MKILSLLLLSSSLAVFTAMPNRSSKTDLKDFINANIEEFNKASVAEDKEVTDFKMVTRDYVVTNEGKEIGQLLVFDNNKGYVVISNENSIIDHNYAKGLDNIYSYDGQSLEYNGFEYLSPTGFVVHTKANRHVSGGSIVDDFNWHASTSFNSKVRYLEQDLDSSYSTLTNTTNAVFHNKTTWSTTQNENDCGPLALANLLWTYKINNVVDLTMGATSSSSLAYSLRSYLNYDPNTGVAFTDILYGDNYFSSTGYYLDYTNVVNGIADTLATTPLIGAYSHGDGHFALVTGKGKSVYKKILGINFYTYWDITNTWSSRYSYQDGYLKCKYWVDNQYITMGFVLKDPNGNVVPLVTNS
jgi:hypothetical protein